MATQIKGNPQNETIALLYTSAQLIGHGESWIQAHSTPTVSDDADYAYIMEWISQCFALESVGDVAAVASQLIPGTLPPSTPPVAAAKSTTASTPTKTWAATAAAAAPKAKATAAPVVATQSKIRLLVTNNRGRNTTDKNRDFSIAFVTVLNEKIKQDGAYYSGVNLTNGVDDLMRVVVEHGWPRVASKITKIKEALTPLKQAQVQDIATARLNAVLDLWGERNLFKVDVDFVPQPAPATGPKKTAQQIYAQQIITLKGHAEKVLNVNAMTPTPNTHERKLDILRDTCNSCKHLLMAIDGVLKRNTAPPMPQDGLSLEFLKKVRRRLWRVLRYSAGPQKFLINGKKIIKKKIIEAQGNPNFIFEEPTWVAKDDKLAALFSAPLPNITIPKDTYINWFMTEFAHKGPGPEAEHRKTAIEKMINKIPRSLSWKPALHCEVTLLTYLYLTNTKIISNAIGVSKLNCYACNVYTAELEKAGSGVRYIMTGTSGKTHHQWLIPNPAVFSAVSGKAALVSASSSGSAKVRTECVEDIRAFLANTGRRNSTGSDSSTGSGGMDANAVFLLGPRT